MIALSYLSYLAQAIQCPLTGILLLCFHFWSTSLLNCLFETLMLCDVVFFWWRQYTSLFSYNWLPLLLQLCFQGLLQIFHSVSKDDLFSSADFEMHPFHLIFNRLKEKIFALRVWNAQRLTEVKRENFCLESMKRTTIYRGSFV